jgi:predicted  nucleic acid-binding Zn-ribbon protein
MKKLQDQLAEVSKTLSELFKKVNQMKRRINKLSAAAAGPKRGRPPGRQVLGRKARVRQDTVLDSIYKAIRRSRKGISIVQLKSKIALDDRQISNALYKLTKKGIVRTKSRGVYIKS